MAPMKLDAIKLPVASDGNQLSLATGNFLAL
jgi:hypothetical protein